MGDLLAVDFSAVRVKALECLTDNGIQLKF